ncbi:MAG: helix-turn-helix domain-containing protein [Oscillospiraceae bacterium]|nr:helix-turn-helix domain-containing protein [Oscillospiraceae bacterium]
MNHYVTGTTIKAQREAKHLTQAELAARLCVSDKTISRWETGRGLPDISLLEPLAAALNMSVLELLSGDCITNRNVSGNMLRSRFYVCPICGNVLHSMGAAVISCCGITLPPLEAEEADEAHRMQLTPTEDEYFITTPHEMTKQHHISFIAYVTTDTLRMVRLYPEGDAQARFQLRGNGFLYCFCTHHGLMQQKIDRRLLNNLNHS